MSVIGRLNIGQLYETSLAKIAEKRHGSYIVEPFVNYWSTQKLSSALKAYGFSEDGKEQLFIIEDNKEQPLQYQSLVGPQYFFRLDHLAEEKIQARGVENSYNYTIRDNQPKSGKRVFKNQVIGSAQRIGEMETWALAGNSAWDILDDLLMVKSDDRELRKQNRLSKLSQDDGLRRSQAFVNLILLLRALYVDLKLLRNGEDV